MLFHRWKSHYGYPTVTTKLFLNIVLLFPKYSSTRWNFNKVYSVIILPRDFFFFFQIKYLCLPPLPIPVFPIATNGISSLCCSEETAQSHPTLWASSSCFCYVSIPILLFLLYCLLNLVPSCGQPLPYL